MLIATADVRSVLALRALRPPRFFVMIVRMTALAPRPMTLDEWYALDEDEPGEIVDGVLVEDEVPGYLHEFVVIWLGRVIATWGAIHGAIVAGSGGKFVVGPRRGRMPDLTVYLAGATRPPLRGLIRVPPSIAVEVVTPTPRDERRDRVGPRQACLGHGAVSRRSDPRPPISSAARRCPAIFARREDRRGAHMVVPAGVTSDGSASPPERRSRDLGGTDAA